MSTQASQATLPALLLLLLVPLLDQWMLLVTVMAATRVVVYLVLVGLGLVEAHGPGLLVVTARVTQAPFIKQMGLNRARRANHRCTSSRC